MGPKNNSDYTEEYALVLVNLTRKLVRITRRLLYVSVNDQGDVGRFSEALSFSTI